MLTGVSVFPSSFANSSAGCFVQKPDSLDVPCVHQGPTSVAVCTSARIQIAGREPPRLTPSQQLSQWQQTQYMWEFIQGIYHCAKSRVWLFCRRILTDILTMISDQPSSGSSNIKCRHIGAGILCSLRLICNMFFSLFKEFLCAYTGIIARSFHAKISKVSHSYESYH